MIQATKLAKSFPVGDSFVEVLSDISLSISAGEFVAVTGPSGSGKSTLLSLLAGLDRPTFGEVLIDGQRIDNLSEPEVAKIRRERIGFVFQSFHLIASLTILENTCLPLAFAKHKFFDKKAEQVLNEIGLGHRMKFFPDQLSGGEKQRVAIARALINDPDIIFADEPTGNLDGKNGNLVLAMLREQQAERGHTLVLVTHDAALASCAPRIIQLRDGKLLE